MRFWSLVFEWKKKCRWSKVTSCCVWCASNRLMRNMDTECFIKLKIDTLNMTDVHIYAQEDRNSNVMRKALIFNPKKLTEDNLKFSFTFKSRVTFYGMEDFSNWLRSSANAQNVTSLTCVWNVRSKRKNIEKLTRTF